MQTDISPRASAGEAEAGTQQTRPRRGDGRQACGRGTTGSSLMETRAGTVPGKRLADVSACWRGSETHCCTLSLGERRPSSGHTQPVADSGCCGALRKGGRATPLTQPSCGRRVQRATAAAPCCSKHVTAERGALTPSPETHGWDTVHSLVCPSKQPSVTHQQTGKQRRTFLGVCPRCWPGLSGALLPAQMFVFIRASLSSQRLKTVRNWHIFLSFQLERQRQEAEATCASSGCPGR